MLGGINLCTFIGLGTVLGLCLATPSGQSHPYLPLPSRVVAQLDKNQTYFENLAVRRNGGILVTMTHPSASLYLIEEPWSAEPSLSVAHTFEDADGITGIVEVGCDTWIIAATKWDTFTTPTANSSTVREFKFYTDGRAPSSRVIASIPEAGVLNGITRVKNKRAVLAADSILGCIWRLDIETGQYNITIDIPETKAPHPESGYPFGVNGIKQHGEYLYWTNTNAVAIYRLRIDDDGYPIKGIQAELVSKLSDAVAVDDLIIGDNGVIWAMANLDNELIAIEPDGIIQTVVGASSEMIVAGITAGKFGRTSMDKHVLYISTDGGLLAPVNGTLIEPAKIVAIDTKTYY